METPLVVGYLIRLVALPKQHAANWFGLVVLDCDSCPEEAVNLCQPWAALDGASLPEGAATCQPRAERSAALSKSEQGVFALKGHNKDCHITCPNL